MSFDPTEADVIRAGVDAGLARVQTSLPAIVKSFDAAAQTVSCNIAVHDGEPIPPLEDVPVKFPSGGGFALRFPLNPGDEGTLVFQSLDPSAFLASGKVSRAASDRLHGYWAEFIPGDCSDPKSWDDHPTASLTIGKVGGLEIEITPSEIKLSRDADDFVALAAKVDAELAKILTLLQSFVPVPNDGGAALKTAAAAVTLEPTAAAKVKAE